MAFYSKEFCRKRLQIWLDAEEAAATGQRYQLGDRSLTRADLDEIRKEITFWEGKLAAAEAEERYGGRNRVYRGLVRDI